MPHLTLSCPPDETPGPGETAPRILRVVTLTDGETIINAFFDRRFRKDQP